MAEVGFEPRIGSSVLCCFKIVFSRKAVRVVCLHLLQIHTPHFLPASICLSEVSEVGGGEVESKQQRVIRQRPKDPSGLGTLAVPPFIPFVIHYPGCKLNMTVWISQSTPGYLSSPHFSD